MWLALAAAGVGVVLVVVALLSQNHPPTTPTGKAAGTLGPLETGRTSTPAAKPAQGAGDPSPAKPSPKDHTLVLPASRPVAISIPAIKVSSPLIKVGNAADGSIEVPAGANINKAAWYEHSPTPGQFGPSVIEGHIDTVNGASVFYDLAALRPGNKIRVTRADGSVAVFTVDALRDFSKDKFPTRAVYGGNPAQPTLRLITCANFDQSIGHYTGNTVVFARLTATHS